MNKNTDLIFLDKNDGIIVIMSDVVQCLQKYRQLTPSSCESAGVIIGERRGIHLIINDISEPGIGDVHHRFSVDRRGPHHQAKVFSAFTQSNGRKQYLGEWHTHPEDRPNPSYIDKKSWTKNLNFNTPMIVIIVGREELWVGKKTGDKYTKLIQT
ncbi:Mov34/MPN/PAD-1 family protein [Edwardsiella tarda]|uniref:CBASS system CD-NTase/cGAS isopeptidase Cap3 n=1 Tax=Edwardsiella tarda TaxID=636 RepID=UPI00351CA43E